MLFKPNFCCNCGEKIERAEWGILTSRRFCPPCASEHSKHDWLPRLAVVIGILSGVFGMGAFFGGSGQPAATMQNETPRKLTVGAKQETGIKDEERMSQPARESPAAAPGPSGTITSDVTREQPRTSSIAPDGPVYYCGAMTKKGKPCSRRVKARGRCWQHAGQPSALVSQSAPDVY